MINPVDLLGIWVSDPADQEGLRNYGKVSLEFRPNGDLIYTVFGEDKDEIVVMRYKIKGDALVTDQPSLPREESSEVRIDDSGRLVIGFEGIASYYVRVPS